MDINTNQLNKKEQFLKYAVDDHSSLVNLVRRAVMLWRMSRDIGLRKMPVA